MRILCLTNFPLQQQTSWLWDYLPDQSDEVDFLWTDTSDCSGGWGKLLTRYPSAYRLAAQALGQLSRKPYDLVVAWEASIGIPFALLRQLQYGPQPPFVLLAFNPGDVPSIFRLLVHLGMRAVDHCTVLTPTEADLYARQYDIPAARITVSPLPSYDLYAYVQRKALTHPYHGESYIHASGRSSRDYRTLVKSVTGLKAKVIIHGQKYNFRRLDIPKNVEIGGLVSREEYHRLVYHAFLEVVPIQPRLRPAGSSQVVFAMMMGKPVVATRNPSLADIVDEGVTGLLVDPNNVEAMRQAILNLLENPDKATQMGAAARQLYEQRHTFGQFAHHTHQILLRVYEESQTAT